MRGLALEVAAQLLQAPADSLTIADGRVVRSGAPAGPSLDLGEIARKLAPGSKLLDGRGPGLAAEGWFHTEHMTYPYGVHAAVVAVDRGTGGVRVEKYLIAYDVGRAVNPRLIEGQLVGGFAQGLGGALSEEFLYDQAGEPLSVTFADYLVPTAHEVPDVDVLITEDAPSPRNPLGLKGAGEGGVNAVGAADLRRPIEATSPYRVAGRNRPLAGDARPSQGSARYGGTGIAPRPCDGQGDVIG